MSGGSGGGGSNTADVTAIVAAGAPSCVIGGKPAQRVTSMELNSNGSNLVALRVVSV